MKAFDIASANASSVLKDAVDACSLLVREERKVIAPNWVEAPFWAGEEDLLEHLIAGRDAYGDIGLTRDELPIMRVSWRENLPPAPGAFEAIVRCIVAQRPILIHYTTIEMGRQATWRRLLPMRLEQVNAHWRFSAHDLERDDFSVRTFALTRVINFKLDTAKSPKRLIPENPNDSVALVKVQLDDRFTPDQIRAIQGEFAIKDGIVRVPHRSVHEFSQQFVQGADANSKVIWPPFKAAEVAK